jgi:histone H3/H4
VSAQFYEIRLFAIRSFVAVINEYFSPIVFFGKKTEKILSSLTKLILRNETGKDEIKYSIDSIEYRNEFLRKLDDLIVSQAIQNVEKDSRKIVSEEDIKNVVKTIIIPWKVEEK